MTSCVGCSGLLPEPARSGPPRLYCTPACRQAFKRRTGVARPQTHRPIAYTRLCVVCAAEFWTSRRTAARCRSCRWLRYLVECRCGRTVWLANAQEYCSSACRMAFRPRRKRSPADERTRKSRRRAAEFAAPGLNQWRRQALLRGWQAAGRSCWCCTAPAATVDHVIPLHRGGTNFEGNLVPACRSHNSSRRDLLIVEWRYRRGWHGTASEASRNEAPNKRDRRDDQASGRGAEGIAPSVAPAA